jgi:hypothetical protein
MPSRIATDVYLKPHCGDIARDCSLNRFAPTEHVNRGSPISSSSRAPCWRRRCRRGATCCASIAGSKAARRFAAAPNSAATKCGEVDFAIRSRSAQSGGDLDAQPEAPGADRHPPAPPRWSADCAAAAGEVPFLETLERSPTNGKPTRRCCAQIRRRLLSKPPREVLLLARRLRVVGGI